MRRWYGETFLLQPPERGFLELTFRKSKTRPDGNREPRREKQRRESSPGGGTVKPFSTLRKWNLGGEAPKYKQDH